MKLYNWGVDKERSKSMIIQRLKIKWASETCINYSIFPTSKGFFVCRGQVLVTCWEGIYILCILHYLLSFYGTNNSISQQCLCILVFHKRFLKCIKFILDSFIPKHIITSYILIIGNKYKSPCKCIVLQIDSTYFIDKMKLLVVLEKIYKS